MSFSTKVLQTIKDKPLNSAPRVYSVDWYGDGEYVHSEQEKLHADICSLEHVIPEVANTRWLAGQLGLRTKTVAGLGMIGVGGIGSRHFVVLSQ